MKKLSTLLWLCLSTLFATAQGIEQNRLLTSNDQPQRLEQAFLSLWAANVVASTVTVEYKAGQSVVLQPGFEARAGSVFTAHTGVVSPLALAENELNTLTIGIFPNPFEELTTITYVLTKPGRTSLYISDVDGKLISQLVDSQYQEAGRHYVEWTGRHTPAGVYMCILEADTKRLSKRIIRK